MEGVEYLQSAPAMLTSTLHIVQSPPPGVGGRGTAVDNQLNHAPSPELSWPPSLWSGDTEVGRGEHGECVPISGGHTLSNVVPPGRVERVVGSPGGDTRAVCLARAVLILVCRPKLTLAVKLSEGVDVTLPPSASRNGGAVSARDMLRTPNLMRQTHVCASTISNVCQTVSQ